MRFDGTNRVPRQVQLDVLDWIEQHKSSKVLAISAPTGVGKSAIVRALQLKYGGIALAPSNILLDQYTQTYPELNFVKGQEHYQCTESDMSCQDKKLLDKKMCDDCSYVECRKRATRGEQTVANPISYYSLTKSEKFETPKVLIVDEAHTLAGMLMLLTGKSFRKGMYKYPEIKTALDASDWLSTLIDRYTAAIKKTKDPQEQLKLSTECYQLRTVHRSLLNSPQYYVVYTKDMPYKKSTDEYLIIEPIAPPKWILDQILKADKIVLLSATLMEFDLWDLGLGGYKFTAVDSPIPKENRPVLYRPNPVPMRFETDPGIVALWIKKQMEEFPNRNTIVHLSYNWVNKLKAYFPEALYHTPETKEATLKTFKKRGGLWLAAGCSEGIDLPGDECRLNLIPMIIQANPFDPAVKKQLALPRGRLKYGLQSLRTLIQQVGRSTRGIEDHSIAIVGDSKLPEMVTKNKQYLPKSFLESLVWRS